MAKITIPKSNKRLNVTKLIQEGILGWDVDNCYPQRMIDLLDASGVATRCVKRFRRFVVGKGFSDPIVYKAVVDNEGGTMDKLLSMCARDYVRLAGVCIHFRYNGLGMVIEKRYMAFQDTRLCLDGRIAYYNNWDGRSLIERYDKNLIQRIHRYNPATVISEIASMEGETWEEKVLNYPGQVLWWSEGGPNQYPVGPADSVAEDVETDYQSKLYKNKNIRTSFVSPGMYVDVGGDEEDKKESEAQQRLLTEFQGADAAGTIMYVQSEPGKEPPKWIPFTSDAKEDTRFQYHETSVERSIVKNYAIPNVLAGILEAGKLATASELTDAVAIYNSETEPDRIIMEEIFSKVAGVPVTILPLDLNSYLVQNGTGN